MLDIKECVNACKLWWLCAANITIRHRRNQLEKLNIKTRDRSERNFKFLFSISSRETFEKASSFNGEYSIACVCVCKGGGVGWGGGGEKYRNSLCLADLFRI